VRQLAAAAGDGPLGSAGSPGQLETSLTPATQWAPATHTWRGPRYLFGLAARAIAREIRRRRRRSPRKERLGSLLLRAAARDLPTLAAHVNAQSPTGATIPTLTRFFWACCSRNRAWDPPPSSSLAEERRLCSLLLRAAARDLPTLAARVTAAAQTGAAISRTRSPRGRSASYRAGRFADTRRPRGSSASSARRAICRRSQHT
jgi:hypothetical protein